MSQSMGIGALGGGDVTFARKFRWTLSSKEIPLELITRIVHVDFIKKLLQLDLMMIYCENKDVMVDEWLGKIIDKSLREKLCLTTYDGCGNVLDQYTFDIDDVKEQIMDFDYASSDVLNMNVTLSFRQYGRQFCLRKKLGDKPEATKCSATLPPPGELKRLKDLNGTFEETTVHHLNGSITLPGRFVKEARR